MKKILIQILIIMQVFVMCSCNSDSNVIKINSADKISENNYNSNWKELYTHQLEGIDDKLYSGYSLIYIDNDDVPELFFESSSHVIPSQLFWVYNGGIYSIGLSINGFYYYEKQNLFMNSGGFTGAGWDTIYKLNTSDSENLCEGNYCVIEGHKSFKLNDIEYDSYDKYLQARNELFDVDKSSKSIELLSLS